MTQSKVSGHRIPADESKTPRPGPRDARGVIADQILGAARGLFATRGYGSTSLRSIAEMAQVDVALVSYYFKSKAGLLDAALTLPPEFGIHVEQAATAPIERRGRAVVAAHLSAWEDEATADILRSIILAAANEPLAMERVRVIYANRFLNVVAAALPEEERHVRAGLVASQMLGVAMSRYVWRVGALVDLSPEAVIDVVSPVIQHYLTGPLVD